MLRKTIVLLTLAAGAGLSLSVGLTPLQASAAAQPAEGNKLGPKVFKLLKAGNDLANQGQYDAALEQLREADAVPDKSAFDQFQINEVRGFVYLKQKNYKDVADLYEKDLESGFLPPESVNNRMQLLTQLFFQIRNLPKAIDYGTRWFKATGSSDATMSMLVGQAYYLNKNYDETITYLESAVKATEAAGQKPDENWLLILQQCHFQKKDAAGVNRALTRLVRYYPKKDYWDILLSNLLRQAPNDDRLTLNIYRLMYQVDVLKSAEDYTEMATIAIQQGSPGDAQAVMERGYSSKVLETSGDKARSQRVLQQAKDQAAQDRKDLPQVEKEARAAKQGEADVRLGQAFLSYNQADKAVEAIQRGIQKGGVKNLDDAALLLGQAYLKLGNGPEGVKAFDGVKGNDLRPIAELWSIYASQL